MTKNELIDHANELGATVRKYWTKEKINQACLDHINNIETLTSQIIEHHNEFQNTFFWAQSFIFRGHTYIYQNGTCLKNGKRKDIRIFKKILEEIAG